MCVMSRKQFWTKLVFIIKYLLIIWLNVCKNIVKIYIKILKLQCHVISNNQKKNFNELDKYIILEDNNRNFHIRNMKILWMHVYVY